MTMNPAIVLQGDLLVDASIRAAVLLIAATVMTILVRRASASIRHAIWALTMLSLVILPVVTWLLPVWGIPVLPAPDDDALSRPPAISPRDAVSIPPTHVTARPRDSNLRQAGEIIPDRTQRTAATSRQPRIPVASAQTTLPVESSSRFAEIDWLVLIWAVGVGLFATLLLLAIHRSRRAFRRSRSVDDADWLRLIDVVTRRLSLRRRVRLLESESAVVPSTIGVLHPDVLLPRAGRDWDESVKRTVLMHEVAHIRRTDVLWQLVGRVACVLNWFNPLAWYGMRQLKLLAEQASDDAVVAAGESPTEYAERLLQIARDCCATHPHSVSVAMAEGNNLERRVHAVIDHGNSHQPINRVTACSLVIIFSMILGVTAAIQPVPASADVEEIAAALELNRSAPDNATPSLPLPADWLTEDAALQRIIQWKPHFGEGAGLRLGVTYPTPQQVYRSGDRIPIELFLYNAGDQPASIDVDPGAVESSLRVTSLEGEPLTITSADLDRPPGPFVVTLNPSQACMIPAAGVRLGQVPAEGRYRLNYSVGELTSGTLYFRVRTDEEDVRELFTGQTYSSGHSTPERMNILQPVFGEAQRGVEVGVAWSTLQRTFADGDVIPMDLFFRNVGDEEVEFRFHSDFYDGPPRVTNSQGDEINISRHIIWMAQGPYIVRIKPGEAWGIRTNGLGIGMAQLAPNFEHPVVGEYELQFDAFISWSSTDHATLTTGTMEFDVIQDEQRENAVQLHETVSGSRVSDGRTGRLMFGEGVNSDEGVVRTLTLPLIDDAPGVAADEPPPASEDPGITLETIRVIDGDTGAPIEGAIVTYDPSVDPVRELMQDTLTAVTLSDANGDVQLPPDAIDYLKLRVTHEKYLRSRFAPGLIIVAGVGMLAKSEWPYGLQDGRKIIKLWRGETLTGTMRFADNTPVTGMPVTVISPATSVDWLAERGGTDGWSGQESPRWESITVTDDLGRYAIAVPPAEVRGELLLQGTSIAAAPFERTVDHGMADIIVERGSIVRGIFLGLDGEPVTKTTITLRPQLPDKQHPAPELSRTTVTDDEGRFELAPASSGPHLLSPWQGSLHHLDIEPDQDLEVVTRIMPFIDVKFDFVNSMGHDSGNYNFSIRGDVVPTGTEEPIEVVGITFKDPGDQITMRVDRTMTNAKLHFQNWQRQTVYITDDAGNVILPSASSGPIAIPDLTNPPRLTIHMENGAPLYVKVLDEDGEVTEDLTVTAIAEGRQGTRDLGALHFTQGVWQGPGLFEGERATVTVEREGVMLSSAAADPISLNDTNLLEIQLSTDD